MSRNRYFLHVQSTPAGYVGLVQLNGRTVATTAARFNDRNAAIRAALRLSTEL